MKMGVEILGLEGVDKLFQTQGVLFGHNLDSAIAASAMDGRNILVEATVGPKSGQMAEAAKHWRVVPDGRGVAVVNDSEQAAYLEYGVGIHNEGPGLKGPIVPRRDRVSNYVRTHKVLTGKEPPRFLSWIDERTGKRVFAKSSKGFKGVAMVRNNWPRIKDLTQHRMLDAVDATLEGRRYG